MDRYGLKHVELTPMHQYTFSAATLCISLECIYIAKNDTWTFQCQVHKHSCPYACHEGIWWSGGIDPYTVNLGTK